MGAQGRRDAAIEVPRPRECHECQALASSARQKVHSDQHFWRVPFAVQTDRPSCSHSGQRVHLRVGFSDTTLHVAGTRTTDASNYWGPR